MTSDITSQDNVIHAECKRCGTCCRKGGPCLHEEDRLLVVEGLLKPSMLVTYRKGELAINPETGEIVRLPSEMIKIRGRAGEALCLFFEGKEKSCRIYEKRPLECRVLKCWDTEESRGLFLKDLLVRSQLIPPNSTLSELVEGYEKAFPLDMIFGVFTKGLSGKDASRAALEELLSRDVDFRAGITKTLHVSDDDLFFFFGRPLSMLLDGFREIVMDVGGEK